MSKHQLHEKFVTFLGTAIEDISHQITVFADNGACVKSLSVVLEDGNFIASIGYIEDHASDEIYSVRVETRNVQVGDLTTNLTNEAASIVNGEVLCHSLYLDGDRNLNVAFLIYDIDE